MSDRGPRIDVHPLPVKWALRFNRTTHRRLPKVEGGMWAVCAMVGGEIVGVGIVGRPKARKSDARVMEPMRGLEVLRVAVQEGVPNACSAIYGAVARAAKAMGAEACFTFIHADESGHSLLASGWVEVSETDGGEWDRPSRPRQLALDPLPKRKFAPAWTQAAKAARLRQWQRRSVA